MKKLLFKQFLSPGDIVMLTAAVRDLHQCYPQQFITDVRTSCAALWENNPYLTPLEEDDPEVEMIECHYPLINRSNQAPYHCVHGFIEFLNERLGLSIRPTRFKGDLHLSDVEKSWLSQVQEFTGEELPFWLVAAGGKYDVTIKWWETRRYQEVVDHFQGKILFVQVGAARHHHPKLEGVLDLRGKTDLRQLLRLVYHAQGVLCPVTALMHLAAAVETKPGQAPERPCVVVAGGREPPHWEAYPHHQFIHTVGALRCCAQGGCWKARTVPRGDGDERDQNLCVDVVGVLPRCMDMISAEEVIRRIDSYFRGGAIHYLNPAQAQAAQSGLGYCSEDHGCDDTLTLHTAARPSAVLIQQASGRHRAMLELSSPLHQAYAARHGISYWTVRGEIQQARPPHWNKILLIERALQMGFDLVIWLDADTLIVKPEEDLRRVLRQGPPIGMCRHPVPWEGRPWHFNSGVMIVRNTPLARDFLAAVWQAGPVAHVWQEQVRINEAARRQPKAVQTLDARWNSTEKTNPCADPIIKSWHGSGPIALHWMKAARAVHLKNFANKTGPRPV